MSVTDNSNKKVILKKIQYIYYLLLFCDIKILFLFDNKSKFNGINPDYVQKMIFQIWKTNVKAQKIDGFAFKIFKMIIADF